MTDHPVIADACYDHLVAEVGEIGVAAYAAEVFDASPFMTGARFAAHLQWRINDHWKVGGVHSWESRILKEYANETTFVAALTAQVHEWAQAERLAGDREREAHEANRGTEGGGPRPA